MSDIKKVEDTIAPHIVDIHRTEVSGIAVTSVIFTEELRMFIAGIAQSLLSELHLFKWNAEKLFKVYHSTANVFEAFNKYKNTSAYVVRNAIRVLNLRIEHCERQKLSSDWQHVAYETNFLAIEEGKYAFLVERTNALIPKRYNESTMKAMVEARQILTNSLINITDEFE
jgi:hypothetical protein